LIVKTPYTYTYVVSDHEDLRTALGNILKVVKDNVRDNNHNLTEVLWNNGSKSGIQYLEDDFGRYALVGYTEPADCYAEIDDGTYGSLNGFRLYYEVAE